MHIGLDIHGVIDSNPEFFSTFTHLMKNAGHTISILTGAQIKPKLIKELKGYNLVWDNLFSITDYHIEKGTEMMFEDSDNPHIDDEMWDKTKGEWCEENKVDMMIDDTARYRKHFKNCQFIYWKNL